jgi:hypothetical protein
VKPSALVIPIALLSLATACSSSPFTGSSPDAAVAAKPVLATRAVLTAQVSNPFSISLVDSKGAPVKSLTAGIYEVKVTDSSATHNFHLTGPGVEATTTVPETSTTTWTVKLSAGPYTFQCDPHAAALPGTSLGTMKGTFTVT